MSGLATYGAMKGSWWLLAWQRETNPGEVLGAIALFGANTLRLGNDRRTNLRLTLVMGSAPIVSLLFLLQYRVAQAHHGDRRGVVVLPHPNPLPEGEGAQSKEKPAAFSA